MSLLQDGKWTNLHVWEPAREKETQENEECCSGGIGLWNTREFSLAQTQITAETPHNLPPPKKKKPTEKTEHTFIDHL